METEQYLSEIKTLRKRLRNALIALSVIIGGGGGYFFFSKIFTKESLNTNPALFVLSLGLFVFSVSGGFSLFYPKKKSLVEQ